MGEYLLLQLRQYKFHVGGTFNGPSANAFPGIVAQNKYTFDGSIVRAGVNYKF